MVHAPLSIDAASIDSERNALRDCLDRSGRNLSRAARDLGVSRTTMYRLLDKHGMRNTVKDQQSI